MTLLPENKLTTEYKIEHKRYSDKKPRTYLGMSGIGDECLRAQWYSWRWATRGNGTVARVNRIFSRGHLEEAQIIKDLVAVGCKVFRRKNEKIIQLTGEVGERQEEIVGFHGHSKGHPDGRITGIIEAPKAEHLLEMKTMKASKFAIVKERGVKKGFLGYYAQLTMYMGKLKLKRAYFVSTNKDTQARYYERVKFDKKFYSALVEREENIILSELPPTKKFSAEHYLCAWCPHYQICHLEAQPNKNCRTCVHADLMPKGKWSCSKTGKNLSSKKQLIGCEQYKRLF